MTFIKRHVNIEVLLVLLVFCLCLTGALLLPMDECPDERGRSFLSNWIFRTGTLPTGDEPATILMSWADVNAPILTIGEDSTVDGWGFSYALRPYLSAIVGAMFMRAASLLHASPRVLLAASRMCSVLSVTCCCWFCLRLGRRLFDRRSSVILFAVLVCFLPQVMFLGMYQNNDSLSLCAVTMTLYYLVEGRDRKWPVKSCIGLAFSLSLGLLSYYSIYGWLLTAVLFCAAAVLTDPEIPHKGRLILKRSALVAGLCLLLAGWFFIRNAILHDGDLFGIISEQASREKMRSMGYYLFDYYRYRDEGLSILQLFLDQDALWIRVSLQSFVGVFGYMRISLPLIQYKVYYALFALTVVLFFVGLDRRRPDRRTLLVQGMILVSSLITLALHVWQSYARDYQPQGRYIITLAIPFAYMLTYGLDGLAAGGGPPEKAARSRTVPAVALTVLWLALFAWAALGTMTKMLP